MLKNKDIPKYENALAKYKRKCRCGHTVTIINKNKKLCSYCGHYVYSNPKDEFIEKLGRTMKERKNEKQNKGFIRCC